MKCMIWNRERLPRIKKAAVSQWKRMIAAMLRGMKRIGGFLSRMYCGIAARKEEIGYYAVLTLVLVALGAAANDYRSRKAEHQLAEHLASADPGIAVQTRPDPTLAPEAKSERFIMPVQGTIVREFSDDELVWSTTLQLWQTHPAVDVSAAAGEAVVSAADGTVTEAYSDPLYGNVIAITHDDGSMLRYSSLNTLQLVEVGEAVAQGDVISAVGTCSAEAELGAHIHLEYYAGQKAEDFALLLSGE